MKHKSSMCLTLCGEIYMLNLDEALLFEADDHYTKIRNLTTVPLKWTNRSLN